MWSNTGRERAFGVAMQGGMERDKKKKSEGELGERFDPKTKNGGNVRRGGKLNSQHTAYLGLQSKRGGGGYAVGEKKPPTNKKKKKKKKKKPKTPLNHMKKKLGKGDESLRYLNGCEEILKVAFNNRGKEEGFL